MGFTMVESWKNSLEFKMIIINQFRSHLNAHVVVHSSSQERVEGLGKGYVHAVTILQVVQLTRPHQVTNDGGPIPNREKQTRSCH